MFVQANQFTRHSGKLSFYGQEAKDFTLCFCKRRFLRMVEQLGEQFAESARLEAETRANLRGLLNGS